MKRRANIAVLTGIFAFAAVITMNLFKLMVVDAKIYQNKADENQFGSKTLPAARGSIYTADGKILAQSATAYQIMIDPKTFINNDLDNPSILHTHQARCEKVRCGGSSKKKQDHGFS